MDEQFLAAIKKIRTLPEHELEMELCKLLARVCAASVQLVDKDSGEQTVILSVAAWQAS